MSKIWTEWEDFITNAPSNICNAELVFDGMTDGNVSFIGTIHGDRYFATVSETCIADYDFNQFIKLSELVQCEYVFISKNGAIWFNSH